MAKKNINDAVRAYVRGRFQLDYDDKYDLSDLILKRVKKGPHKDVNRQVKALLVEFDAAIEEELRNAVVPVAKYLSRNVRELVNDMKLDYWTDDPDDY